MPPYPTVTMRNGDRGDHVRQLQALLNRDYIKAQFKNRRLSGQRA